MFNSVIKAICNSPQKRKKIAYDAVCLMEKNT